LTATHDGNKARRKIIVYLSSPLILAGILVFLIIIDKLTRLLGITLSPLQKLVALSIAMVFILVGLFLKLPLAYRVISNFSGLTKEEIELIHAERLFRAIDYVTFLSGFILVFSIYLDEKIAVYNLDIARYYNDTSAYLQVSSLSLKNISFWAGDYPFTLPLFYKTVGYNLENYFNQTRMNQVAYIQFLFSIFSWSLLAIVISLTIKDKLAKIFSCAVILMIGASIDISSWDKAMLSESISTSLLVIFLATIIFSGIVWEKKRKYPAWKQILFLGILLLVGIIYSFARDTNSFFILFLGGAMVVGIFIPAIRRHPLFISYIAILAGFISIFILQTISVNNGKRETRGLIHVVYDRVIQSEDYLNYYIQQGMPYNEKVVAIALIQSHVETIKAERDPELKPFFTWMEHHGEIIAVKFLLSHPSYVLFAPMQDFWEIVNSGSSGYRKINAFPNTRINILTTIFYTKTKQWLFLPLILFLFEIVILWRKREGRIIWYLALALFLSTFPLALLVWHSDSYEIMRHSLQIAVNLHLSAWIVIILLFDKSMELIKRLLIERGS
jgi:hypothetical protein